MSLEMIQTLKKNPIKNQYYFDLAIIYPDRLLRTNFNKIIESIIDTRLTVNNLLQAKSAQNKAFDEDPTVFQYDEVYESIKNEKEAKKDKSKEQKKPKYIENLLKTANKRKIENERRIERQVILLPFID